jgi:CheY-like chemotaxis protein
MPTTQPYILLADDNLDDQSFIRDAFSYTGAGYHLKIVDSGKEVIEYLKSRSSNELPSLIVLDYNMPELNGIEVLQLLLKEQRYAHVPKIMLSTSFYQKHIDHCLGMGANGYLIKPDNYFDWKKLAHRMLEYVNPSPNN